MVANLAPQENAAELATFPGSPFQLYQPFAPAGDQPAAIDGLMEGLADGLAFQTLLGVWPISEERLSGYLEKAMREAKLHTSWVEVNEEHEAAVQS